MSNFTKAVMFLWFSLMLFTACEKEFDEYYKRPDWLEDPLYQQLAARGNFTHMLACIDKAGYKHTLNAAGYFTLFAPNDDAFEAYFEKQKVSGIEEIDSTAAQELLSYLLVYNAFKKDQLSDYQSNDGWVADQAFKRRTAYYIGVYNEMVNGHTMTITPSNRNGDSYVFGDNNNKYIPFFEDAYMSNHNLDASDYEYFYDKAYTGFQVAGASVITANILAENGVAYEIDEVINTLPSLDEYLTQHDQYSLFKSLYEDFMVTYRSNPDITNRYRVLTGSNDSVYVKYYNSALAYSLNNENFLKEEDNDGQSDGWTLFAPENAVLSQYIQQTLLEHYASLETMPRDIIIDFLNAHMWQTTVWPSKFKNTYNFYGEEARFDAQADVTDAQVLSNGFFYGTSRVQESNLFTTVYGKAYLNPEYSMMIRALGDLKYTISNPNVQFTVFMMADSVMSKAGFSYNITRSEWEYQGSGVQAAERLRRDLALHIAITFNGELNDLSGDGIVETYNGEYIKYKDGQVYAAGNRDNQEMVSILGQEETLNGRVYYTDKLLVYSEKLLGLHIAEFPEFERFFQYLNNATIYNAGTGEIEGTSLGNFYTAFIPTNEAIEQAVADGYLPAEVSPSDNADKQHIANFIRYHILANKTIIPNGVEAGIFETLQKNIEGDVSNIRVFNQEGLLQVQDNFGTTATVVNANSNKLANFAILHQIDTYLKYPND